MCLCRTRQTAARPRSAALQLRLRPFRAEQLRLPLSRPPLRQSLMNPRREGSRSGVDRLALAERGGRFRDAVLVESHRPLPQGIGPPLGQLRFRHGLPLSRSGGSRSRLWSVCEPSNVHASAVLAEGHVFAPLIRKWAWPAAPDPASAGRSTRCGAAASVPSSSGPWGVRGAVEPPGPFEAAACRDLLENS